MSNKYVLWRLSCSLFIAHSSVAACRFPPAGQQWGTYQDGKTHFLTGGDPKLDIPGVYPSIYNDGKNLYAEDYVRIYGEGAEFIQGFRIKYDLKGHVLAVEGLDNVPPPGPNPKQSVNEWNKKKFEELCLEQSKKAGAKPQAMLDNCGRIRAFDKGPLKPRWPDRKQPVFPEFWGCRDSKFFVDNGDWPEVTADEKQKARQELLDAKTLAESKFQNCIKGKFALTIYKQSGGFLGMPGHPSGDSNPIPASGDQLEALAEVARNPDQYLGQRREVVAAASTKQTTAVWVQKVSDSGNGSPKTETLASLAEMGYTAQAVAAFAAEVQRVTNCPPETQPEKTHNSHRVAGAGIETDNKP